MVKIDKSTVVDAPVERVWAVLRDFNGHDQYHPAVRDSAIERGRPSDQVGCVRRFHLQDGSELRELLLTLSDADMAFSYCLLDTPVPLLNYVAHNRLVPVTDGDRTFWHWHCRFDTPPGMERQLFEEISRNIYEAGFAAVRAHLGLPAAAGGAH
jgi:hypothetical protein